MLYNAFIWFWRRFRPAEGWLSLFLLLAAIVCLTTAITTVEWITEDDVVPIGGLLGLLLGVVVAKGPLRPFAAWILSRELDEVWRDAEPWVSLALYGQRVRRADQPTAN